MVMKTLTYEIDVPDNVSKEEVTSLLRDAISNFKSIRSDPRKYVAENYTWMSTEQQVRKSQEVENRQALAMLIRRSL